MKIIRIVLIVIVLGVLGFLGYRYLQHQKIYPSTDDAYIQANVINIAPQINGQITKVYVKNHSHVKAGQPLFDINPNAYLLGVQKASAVRDDVLQQVRAANANVAAAKSLVAERHAELTEAELTATRILALVKKHLVAKQQADDVTSQLNVAKAAFNAANSQLKQAEENLGQLGDKNASVREASAALAEAKLDLKHTTIFAPTAGYVINVTLQPGAEVTQFNPLFSLIADHEWWADANFKETDLQRIKANQTASIKVDMYPDHTFKGHVQSISTGSGSSFSLLPPENATGNWVKVTQRFPVKVIVDASDPKFPLRMGASATVVINTTAAQQK